MIMLPLLMPEYPSPPTTRPTMSATEDGAAPHIAEPIMKMTKKVNHVHYKISMRRSPW
jgi:hypothetical protein